MNVLRISLVACLFLACGVIASADSVTDAVVCVEAKQSNGVSRDAGDGVCVRCGNGTAMIVTCWHCVRGRDTAAVTFPSRKRFVAKVIASDPDSDLALLLVKCGDVVLPTVPVAAKDAAEGDEVTLVGDSSAAEQPIRKGQRISSLVNGFTHRGFQTNVPVWSGDSGGGIFNSKGELVSITSGFWTDDPKHQGHGPATEAIRLLTQLSQAVK